MVNFGENWIKIKKKKKTIIKVIFGWKYKQRETIIRAVN